MKDFLHMGGYGVYVWSAYAIWLVVMLANVVQPLIKYRDTLRRLARPGSEGPSTP